MAYAVGIDLGTTNSIVSIYRRGIPETVAIEGRANVPSIVSFRNDGSVLVGHAAKARLLLDPENTVSSVKRFMGDRKKTYKIGRKSLTPTDISSLVLKKLVEGARKTLGEDIWDAVITVPAYFTEGQREATRKAGEEAGLNVLRLTPEPTAAAIAYGLDKGKDQTIMVYDLGGGTFDVSILQIRGNKFEVKAVGGDTHLGGDDLDHAIMEWVNNKFSKVTGKDILKDKSRDAAMARQRLKEAAETAKIELSQSERAVISIPECMGHPIDMEISLKEYNEIISPLLKRTVMCMHSVLKDARLKPVDIDRVILVGGSTKNRSVREIVAREIKEPYVSDRVDEVVSHGAAIVASSMFLPEEDALPIEISDVTGHSLGIAMVDDYDKLFFKPIIQRQTSYPCKRGCLGFTVRPNQTSVLMRVFRGENMDPEKNTLLGELELPVTPPSPEYVPLGAVFELDKDGIIHFTAVRLPAMDTYELKQIYDYYQSNKELDIDRVDTLIKSGKVTTRSVDINSKS